MMQFPVLVKTTSATQYETRAIGLPKICEVASTEEEALAKVSAV